MCRRLVWYSKGKHRQHRGGVIVKNATDILSAENYKHKNKNISIIASDKKLCQMHLVRQALAMKCKNEGLADTYGKFDGGPFVPMELPFQYYRYSIVVENLIQPFYFTEKILNCFAAQTIPIYIGATEIHKFFNSDGIITFNIKDIDHIENILKQCTKEEYERRLPAIIDNYNRTIDNYVNRGFWDNFYEEYL